MVLVLVLLLVVRYIVLGLGHCYSYPFSSIGPLALCLDSSVMTTSNGQRTPLVPPCTAIELDMDVLLLTRQGQHVTHKRVCLCFNGSWQSPLKEKGTAWMAIITTMKINDVNTLLLKHSPKLRLVLGVLIISHSNS